MEDFIAGLRDAAAAALRPADGRIEIEGLDGEIEVLTDRWGVPHVYASTRDDCYAAQGYLHAAERLWQMDFTRRLAQGRLSELVGELALPTDRFFRTLGLGRTARRFLEQQDERSRAIAAAYARGVRAALATLPPPVEYSMLGAQPEFDDDEIALAGIATTLLMTFTLSTNWPFELIRAELARRLGPERARQLTPFIGAEPPLTIPTAPGFPGAVQDLVRSVLDAGAGHSGLGSNNWVVSGAKTTTGRPLLCNDPHLLVQMPAIWFEMHLACPDMEVAGVTIPGIPGIVIGHNRRVAWGFTNTGADVEDLYLERLSEDGTRYEHAGAWHDVEVLEERIFVRGEAEPRVHEVRATRHGPLLTALIEGTLDPQVREGAIADPLALRWIHYEVPVQTSSVEAFALAEDWASFREAARGWPSAGQNMVYADVDGTIGYQFTGTVPIRARGSGAAPLPGWTGEHEWTGTIPFEDLPHAVNPDRGFLATANHRMVDLDYPYYLTNDWEPPYRIRRITQLLTETERLSHDDMARIQTDTHSGLADELLPLLLRVAPSDGFPAEAFKHVEAWDRRLDADSVGAAIFVVWQHKLAEALFREQLGADLFDAYHRMKSWTTAWSAEATREVLRNPEAFWVGGDGADNQAARDRIVALALSEACDELRARLGDDVSQWRWGRLHLVTFRHPIGRALPPLDALLSAGPFEAPGGDDTINRGQFTAGEDYHDAAVASYRQILDVGDWDASRTIITVGQSGNPASPHHHDQSERWLRGEYKPMPFTRAAVEEASAGRLVIAPGA